MTWEKHILSSAYYIVLGIPWESWDMAPGIKDNPLCNNKCTGVTQGHIVREKPCMLGILQITSSSFSIFNLSPCFAVFSL